MARLVTRELRELVDAIGRLHTDWRGVSAPLVAISGIDGSGKSAQSSLIAEAVNANGIRAALIGIDPWQAPQTVRFGQPDPGVHFYQQAIRFDEMFVNVVDPLVRNRSLHLSTMGIRTDADVWFELNYDFEDIDVVLLEGIFLLRRDFVPRYDLRIWIDCTFETAVERALERNVERLPEERIVEDYAQIYHAAQRHHFAIDAPEAHADIVLINDPRLVGDRPSGPPVAYDLRTGPLQHSRERTEP